MWGVEKPKGGTNPSINVAVEARWALGSSPSVRLALQHPLDSGINPKDPYVGLNLKQRAA
jgi:hypothetical protein